MSDGKNDELEELYHLYFSRIQSYLYYLSGDYNLAEELVQETFYRAGRSLLLKRKITYVSAWLFTIARNLYFDHAKKSNFKIDIVSFEDLSAPNLPREKYTGYLPERSHENRELQKDIQVTLMSLTENQRTALLLKDHQSLTYQEIAEIMDLSVMSVKSLLHRARLAFRRKFEEYNRKGDEQ
ncbi:RNA polymerase sigma factor [Dethiobacter alkaliphilus]|uniref:RNA polymerase, sigma-24 subunit, ECF subfamily n=1 Tax=Dethiobacter alkaliphilus AHT 1 TaxID=555088 RepID=C0GD60_DETAL|nr:RNA polymerase sigma factor [Dethiobacter alkaliphilus]EEG78581.1 RNA polymerase, sigma-24 subunit, ECF subfamily [Dethiobacter alkaliphilus AHT 1]